MSRGVAGCRSPGILLSKFTRAHRKSRVRDKEVLWLAAGATATHRDRSSADAVGHESVSRQVTWPGNFNHWMAHYCERNGQEGAAY